MGFKIPQFTNTKQIASNFKIKENLNILQV